MTAEAIILAGGLGTRLRSAVPDLPKCMAPVGGKPFLYYLLSNLQKQGIRKFILSLGYKHELIIDYVSAEFNANQFEFAIEEEPLGTGGAIKLACTKSLENTVVVVNGDTFFQVELDKLVAFHEMCGSNCTLALKPMENFDRYGVIELNTDYSIRSFQEKNFYASGLINGGVYALNTNKFMQENLPYKFSFEKDYLEAYYMNRRMYGVVQDGYFIDIGIPEDYARANQELGEEFKV